MADEEVWLTYEIELWFSEPLVPGDDSRARLLLFTETIIDTVLWASLSEADVEDDRARYTDTGHNQHQTLHSYTPHTDCIFTASPPGLVQSIAVLTFELKKKQLFSPPGILARRAIYFADINGRPHSKSISGTTERIFIKILGSAKRCKGLMNLAFIWQSLNRRCHDNQVNSQNRRFSWKNLFVALPFQNELES